MTNKLISLTNIQMDMIKKISSK